MRLEKLLSMPFNLILNVVERIAGLTNKMGIVFVGNNPHALMMLETINVGSTERYSYETQQSTGDKGDTYVDADPDMMQAMLRNYSNEMDDPIGKKMATIALLNKTSDSLSVKLYILFSELLAFKTQLSALYCIDSAECQWIGESFAQAFQLMSPFIVDLQRDDEDYQCDSKCHELADFEPLDELIDVIGCLYENIQSYRDCSFAMQSDSQQPTEQQIVHQHFLLQGEAVKLALASVKTLLEQGATHFPSLPAAEFSNIIAISKTNLVELIIQGGESNQWFGTEKLNVLFKTLILKINNAELQVDDLQWGASGEFKLNDYLNNDLFALLEDFIDEIQRGLDYGKMKTELRERLFSLAKELMAARDKICTLGNTEFSYNLRSSKETIKDLYFSIQSTCETTSISLETELESSAVETLAQLTRIAHRERWESRE